MQSKAVHVSKFLSLVLRHQPDAIGLTLDSQGWASIEELLIRSEAAGIKLNKAELLNIVESSEKKRFSVSADGLRIRAAQGHSVAVDLGLIPQQPPDTLYHGTGTVFVDSILSEGLQPRQRQHVHLSLEARTALKVGRRHGNPTVLRVDAGRMHAQGFQFFLADNGVWLTHHVPAEFLLPLSESETDSATTSRQPKLST